MKKQNFNWTYEVEDENEKDFRLETLRCTIPGIKEEEPLVLEAQSNDGEHWDCYFYAMNQETYEPVATIWEQGLRNTDKEFIKNSLQFIYIDTIKRALTQA